MIKPENVPTPVKVGVTAAMALATYAGSNAIKGSSAKTGVKAAGILATLAYVAWAFGDKKKA